jgi:sugar lactone lactonase YvrE
MRLPALARLVGAVLLAAPAALAQSADWRAFPAFNEVVAVAAAPDGLWAGTDAGVFFYGVPDGELVTVTPVDGLRGGRLGALAYDAARGALWLGYGDGLVERLDPEAQTVTPFYGLVRADQYPSRGVRRIRVSGDSLYLSTDFGVVVFDAARGEVRDAYARIGDLAPGTAVNDVLAAPLPDGRPGLWVATAQGVYAAARAGGGLQTPSAWARADGVDGEALSLARFDGDVFAGTDSEIRRRSGDGVWTRVQGTGRPVTTLVADGGRLLGLTRRSVYRVGRDGAVAFYTSETPLALRDLAVGPGGALWAGDGALGLIPLPPPAAASGPDPFTPDPIAPPGPSTNAIARVDVGPGGVLWLATRPIEASGASAINRFEDGAWTAWLTSDPTIDIARASFRSGVVGPDGAFYAGSEGDGLTVVSPDGTLTTYDEEDSSLGGAGGDDRFVRVDDVAFEGDRRWVGNLSDRLLHLFAADGAWAGLPFPRGSTPPNIGDLRLAVDPFGQKWLALRGAGLVAWDTGDDPASPADDAAVRFVGAGSGGRGLPDGDVRDVVVDGEGRVWVGTARGIAYVFSPGSAFGGSADLAEPQWARTEDGTDFLLRDVEVNDLEADPAGQVWVATTTGAYLVNAAGNAVVRRVASDTSPLPSDEVFSVAVDPRSGRVYFVTEEGLFSTAGDATLPTPGSEALVVAPSPFRPAEAPGVVVSGLSAGQSDVRVTTVAGDVVWAGSVAGGSFQWDGRDRAGRPAPSGVYLVAVSGEDGRTLVGKVALIR